MLTLLGWTIGICLTWPPLQALVTDRETPAQTAWLVGVYNLVWSGFAGLANFFGGAVYEIFGSGGLFWWPAPRASYRSTIPLFLPITESQAERLPSARILSNTKDWFIGSDLGKWCWKEGF